MRFALPIVAMVLLTACGPEPAFPPPAQHVPKPYFARVTLDMKSGQPLPAGAEVLSGVEKQVENLDWRWMSTPAIFGFQLDDHPDWQLELHLTIVDKVREQLGPQKLTVLLNGKELTRVPLEKPGPFTLTLPATLGPKPTVELQIEPCLPQPYSPPYCALLHSIGWKRELK